jgi:hypothetical protein
VARGRRTLASLRGVGGRFPAVHHVNLTVDDAQGVADALAAAAGPGGWPGVRSLRFDGQWADGPLAPALAALVALCPNLETVEAMGRFGAQHGEPGAGQPHPGVCAALAPAAATLQAALLRGCRDLGAVADVTTHLGSLTRLTRLELGIDSLALDGWAAASEALPRLTALEVLRLPGPKAGGASARPPRLAALPRLRELSMLPNGGARALSAALRELRPAGGGAAALTALTSLSLLHNANVETWRCGRRERMQALVRAGALAHRERAGTALVLARALVRACNLGRQRRPPEQRTPTCTQHGAATLFVTPCLQQACELAALPPSPAPPNNAPPPSSLAARPHRARDGQAWR